MTDYLISDKIIILKKSCILRVINFLIFRDSFRFFLNYVGFIFNLYKFKNIKIQLFIRVDVVIDVARAIICRHVMICARATCRTLAGVSRG